MAGLDSTKVRAREDRTVYRALRIVERRMKEAGPLLGEPSLVRQWLQMNLAGKDLEVFCALFLDAQNHLIGWDELARGTLSEACVYPREVVKAAIRHGAAAVIFAHNHPSGGTTPSEADRRLTDRLKAALALIEVRVVDHFVIGRGPAHSFAEHGLI